jgi:uncharacterized protein YndB with AHSA1/START domain
MPERSVTHSTFVIERSYPANPQRVFAAFADPAKKRRWFREEGEVETLSYEMDFRAGGRESSSFRSPLDSPLKGATLTNETVYQDIVPDKRIVFAYTMAVAGYRFSASLSTVELVATAEGTSLIFTEQAAFFENSDGPEMRREGWSHLLDSLGKELAR